MDVNKMYRDVKFGINLMLPLPLPIQRIYGFAERIDKLGFDCIWMADHILWEPDRFTPEVWSVLSAIAARTEKVRLGTCVSDPHRRHPAVFAQTTATLDHLSNGRVIIGLGAGEDMNLDPFGIEHRKPVAKMVEFIDVIRRLWKSDSSNTIDFNGEFYTLEKANLEIKPIQESIPIYIGANGPKTRKITGKIADGWIPTPFLEAPETYKEHLQDIKEGVKEANRSMDEIDTCLIIYTSISDREDIRERASEDFSIMGNVDEVIEKIDKFIKSGVKNFNLMNVGPDVKEVEKIYVERIIPYFKGI